MSPRGEAVCAVILIVLIVWGPALSDLISSLIR